MPGGPATPGRDPAPAADRPGGPAVSGPSLDSRPWLALSVQARRVSAAVGHADEVLSQAFDTDLAGADEDPRGRPPGAAAVQAPSSRHALAVIGLALERARLTLSGIAGLCVADGPGPFTAIRVAMSLIQGIGIGRGLPVIAVPSLAALAVTAARREPQGGALAATAGPALVLAAIDARMGECYFGAWSVRRDRQPAQCLADGVGPGVVVRAAFQALVDALDGAPLPAAGETAGGAGGGPVGGALPGVRCRPWPARLVLAGSGFGVDPVLAAWEPCLASSGAASGIPPDVRTETMSDIEADAAGVLATALAPAPAGSRAAWTPMPAASLRPRYVRDKVALDVDEQRRLAQARDAASSRR